MPSMTTLEGTWRQLPVCPMKKTSRVDEDLQLCPPVPYTKLSRLLTEIELISARNRRQNERINRMPSTGNVDDLCSYADH